ncbi:ABC transporter substrate-binding protein [Marinitoga litoralis]|jgi:multiple sugar transport system substrate-binding protein|uniref:ABC transporter substrate-binding protein n=1 Tax=Marinitoga litoralis TaxID=570855 RepID=UPI0019605A5A|nr:extracellular solute-binding protein [Marinitoga litoralis]MBM7558882.1 multiple sugar transport system substrate-binding protein [Marinitoga litoralis]
MKKLLVLMLVVILVSSVFAKITFWTTEVESNRMQRIRALATIFKAQTGIEVEVVPVEENDLLKQIPIAKNAGTLPDLLEGGIEPMLLLGSENFLDEDLATKIIMDFGDVYDGAARMLSNGEGKYYGIPFHAWVQGIWYRKDMFASQDLGDPITWYNIALAAKVLNDPAKGVYGIILPKKADAYAEQVFTEVALANGARPIDEMGNITFNTPEMIEAFRFYKELGKYSKPGFTTVLDALKGYLNGEAAMIFYSTYIMDDIAVEEVQKGRINKFNPELVKNTGFANKMINIRPTSYGQVVALGITKNANKEEVEKFVKFLMTDKNYVYWVHMAPGGMNPTRKSVAESDAFLDNPVLERYGKAKIAEIVAALDSVERFEFLNGKVITDMSKLSANFVIGKAINYMFANDWTPQQTAMWAQKEAEKILGK